MRGVPGGLVHPQHGLDEQGPRARQDHREYPHRHPSPRGRVTPHAQAPVIDLRFTARLDGPSGDRHLVFEALFSESGCHITPYRRFRHLDTVIITQSLSDRGHRHRSLELLGDPPVMHRDLRPGQRPHRRVEELGKPATNPLAPQRLVEWPVGHGRQPLGQRRRQILADGLAIDIQRLMDLHLGPPGMPMPEHLHEVGHVPRSPRHSGPFQGPLAGTPERSEPEQHPNPDRTRPKGWGIT